MWTPSLKPPMPRPAFIAVVVALAGTLTPLGCDAPAKPPPQVPSALIPATKEFTAESRGLRFSFRYPADWKLDPSPTSWATLSMTLVPPGEELGTRIVFVLVDGETAAKMNANGPMIPRAAVVFSQSKVTIGGVAFDRTEWRGTFADDPTYRHSVELQGEIGGRVIILQAYTSAPAGSDGDGDRWFERWRPTFEAVLATAHLESP